MVPKLWSTFLDVWDMVLRSKQLETVSELLWMEKAVVISKVER